MARWPLGALYPPYPSLTHPLVKERLDRTLATQADQGGWEWRPPPGSGSPGICHPGCPPSARWRWQGEAPCIFCMVTVPGPAWCPAGALGHCVDAPNPRPSPSGQSRPAARGQCPGHREEKAGALVIAGVMSAVASVMAGEDASSAWSCRQLRWALCHLCPSLQTQSCLGGGAGHWSMVSHAGASTYPPGGNRGCPRQQELPGQRL